MLMVVSLKLMLSIKMLEIMFYSEGQSDLVFKKL
jgi:hypothetical protein